MKNVYLLLISISLASFATAEPEIKGTPDEVASFLKPDAKTVSVSGYAKRVAFSDLAHVTVVVVTKDKKLGAAMEGNSNIRSGVIKELRGYGVAQERINNSYFSSSPQYGWFGSKPSNFEVVNRLKVTITDEGELTFLSKVADQLDEVSIGDIRFEHSLKDKFQNDVSLEALADAQSKASQYADQLGIILKPVSFTSSGAGPGPTPLSRFKNRRGSVIEEVVLTASSKDSSYEDSAPITFEEIRYESSATVLFEVEHK